jgi:hypothetical protein
LKRCMYLIMTALLVSIFLVGCGKDTEELDSKAAATEKGKETKKETKDKVELGNFEIVLGGEVTEEDNKFMIEGSSNLLPGSRVVGEVLVDDGDIFSSTTELVQEDGKFHMELDHHKYGEAEIIVRFDFDGVQEDEIKRHYGEKGQKLTGPFIYKHKTHSGIFKKAEAKIDYIPGESSNLTFAAPDWHELPEDYGDPRVWIEIEELTEDGEFFYMQGRSNILEGSEMKVSYGWNSDKTRVNPDGSFDFKIDYEYLEDKEFVIKFEPSSLQWNEIEEAYGSNGQKLVGNLVETHQFNTDKQFIEMRVPWDGNATGEDSGEGENSDETDDATADEEENDEK